ncbi:unnamed protein product, partial [Meganyctiphanes norvegica]
VTTAAATATTIGNKPVYNYVVDPVNGDDTNIGRWAGVAFKTIQRCVDELKLSGPGSECHLRSGRYHEVININGLKGSTDKPYTIKNWKKEVPIWDGTVAIQPSKWDHDNNTGICSATITDDIFALFLDDDLLTPARWPDALWSNKTIFSNENWGHCDETSEYGYIIDNGEADLAASGINATGAMAILNIGSFNTYARPVVYHEPNTNNFTYNHDMGSVHWKPNKNQYYLEASLALLNVPGEWYYDSDSKILYLIPVSGVCPDPASDTLRGRVIDYGLTITNSKSVTISGITFFAANINAYSIDYANSHIDEIKLDSVKFNFPSSSHRMLGSTLGPKQTNMIAKAKKIGGGIQKGKISVVNSEFVGGEGVSLVHAGQDNLIDNNLFAYNDWSGIVSSGGGTVEGNGHGENITHNTFWYNGQSAGIRPGMTATIKYNHIKGQCSGNLQNDGAAIQVQNAPQDGITISHNWIHDSPKMAIRFDTPASTNGGTDVGFNGYQGFNVVWNTEGMMVKGDNHTVENNLALDRYSSNVKCTLCVILRLRGDPWIENNNTVVINNVATLADGGAIPQGGRYILAGGVIENNYFDTNVKDEMVDPDNYDFRPVDGGALTSGTETKGPYQPENQSTEYWIPGQKLDKTSTPVPVDGATVPYSRDAVMFLQGRDAEKHNFYLGTKYWKTRNAKVSSPEFQETKTINEGNIFSLPSLLPNTVYYWRVDAARNGVIYKGDVWSFTT